MKASDKSRHRHPPPDRLVRWIMSALGILALLSLGYLLGWSIFQLTGTPPPLAAFLVQAILCFAIAALSAKLFQTLVKRRNGHPDPWDFGRSILDALDRIARGDFDVIIPTGQHDPLEEVAESVNRMARELGNLESQRQEFVSNVSHELQSPLTSISGFAQLLRSPDLSQEQRLHYLDIITAESKRLSRLSDNLLRLSALDSDLEPLSLAPITLAEQLRSAILVLEPQWAAKELLVELQLPEVAAVEDVNIEANGELMEQVWMNILHNAIKFTPGGGSIIVSLNREGNQAVVRVQDDGIGISEADSLHIFERFYRADRARDRSLGGNGLGLPLAKRIVDMHGGTISANSQPGNGTTFTIELPISVREAGASS